jgi:UDP-N-acetylmuramate--alanine ligase
MNWQGKHIHFVGIGGIGMSGIAKMLLSQGAVVSGSDLVDSRKVKELSEAGAHVAIGHRPENIPAETEVVVVSAAIKRENVELRAAHKIGLRVMKYAETLGLLMRAKKGLAVSGTHGKTTTTAMISTVLQAGGLNPTFVIGGDVARLGGSSKVGVGELFVVEACEYDRSFLNLSPNIAVLTCIEEDHLDYYHGLKDIVGAFAQFCALVPAEGLIVANNQDRNVRAAVEGCKCAVETYGITVESDWMATEPRWHHDRNLFEVAYRGKTFGAFALQKPGVHNVLDAVAAIAVCNRLSVGREVIEEGLAGFSGVDRRFQILGECGGVVIVDDYAHHPTEIQVTLKAAREKFNGARLWCVFQPHQHSRTRFLLKDFARSFGGADKIVVPDIYFVRDSEEDRKSVSSMDLVGEISNLGGDAIYLPGFGEIIEFLCKNLRPGDVVMTMGAGNVDEIARGVMSRLLGAREIRKASA